MKKAEKIKVALISNTAFSLYNFRLGLMRALKDNGIEVIAIAPEDDYSSKIENAGFNYLALKNLDRKGKNPLKDLSLLLEFIKIYRQHKPHLVINFTIKPNIYSSIACGILGIKTISVITGLGHVFIKEGIITKIVRLLYRLAFRFNAYIVCLNDEDIKIISDLADNSKFLCIKGEGIDTEYFSPSHFRDLQKQSAFVFLFIGRLLKEKGIYEFVEAGKRLRAEFPDVELWVLGSVDLGNPSSISEKTLKEWEEKGWIRYLGFQVDVRPIIFQSDCVVLPSYYREGLPRTLLEAMAMERPIITTDSVGCRDTCIDGVNGLLVKPKDVEGLYYAMRKIIQLPEDERKRMGEEGRRIVEEHFSQEIVVRKYMNLIETVLYHS